MDGERSLRRGLLVDAVVDILSFNDLIPPARHGDDLIGLRCGEGHFFFLGLSRGWTCEYLISNEYLSQASATVFLQKLPIFLPG